jgi:hypothetical protein
LLAHDALNGEERMEQHTDRYIPADTNGGWGFAACILALAAALIVTVTIIHKNSYRHPTDVTWHGKGSGDFGESPPAGRGAPPQ